MTNPCRDLDPLKPTVTSARPVPPLQWEQSTFESIESAGRRVGGKEDQFHRRSDPSVIPDSRHKTSVPISPSASCAATSPPSKPR